MRYAIQILKIEKAELQKALNTIDKYSVHPEYNPCNNGLDGKLKEIEYAIEILRSK